MACTAEAHRPRRRGRGVAGRAGWRQRGYLLEVPLVMAVVGVLAAVLYPRLSGWQADSVLVVAALVWLAGLYYVLVVPGWQPGAPRRSRLGRLAAFAGAAGLILLGLLLALA
jgi:hypothetical protein